MPEMSLKALRRLCGKALAAGARQSSLSTVEWDISGDCQSPEWVEHYARPTRANPAVADWSWRRALAGSGLDPRIRLDALAEFGYTHAQIVDARMSAFTEFEPKPVSELRTVVVGPGHADNPLRLLMETRCRKCERCLRRRSRAWAAKARSEISAAHRTWFGTLTLRPEEHYRALLIGRSLTRAGSVDPDESPDPDAEFHLRLRAISPELTKYLKRVRKESGAPLRYLLVAERHKSGLPHFHMLVHETSQTQFVRKRTLDGQWRLGFSQWRLTGDDVQAATYLCKYLAKSAAARVRASQAYGNNWVSQLSEGELGPHRPSPLLPLARSATVASATVTAVGGGVSRGEGEPVPQG